MKVEKLRVNQIENPLGYAIDPLSFSWVVTECESRQKWARIRVAEACGCQQMLAGVSDCQHLTPEASACRQPTPEVSGEQQQMSAASLFDRAELLFDGGEDAEADSMDYQVSLALKPRTGYLWQVTVMAESGESVSAVGRFETGKMDEPWVGQWISPKKEEKSADLTEADSSDAQKEDASRQTVDASGQDLDDENQISAILAKKFYIEESWKVSENENASCGAKLYICGLGVYECWINGQKVGEEYLAPGYHSYDFHLQAQTYDAAPYLKPGENEICIWLGEGWFKGRLGFDGGFTDIYGDRLYAIAELYVKNQDGETLAVRTDDTWESRISPVIFNNIYDGEVYDARREYWSVSVMEGHAANSEAIDAAGSGQADVFAIGSVELAAPTDPQHGEIVPCGSLVDRYGLPIVKKESFVAKELIHTPKGETVLDFGQEITGWVEIDCDFPEGTRITLSAGEILQNDCFYRDNLRTAKAEFTYISNGKKALVRPHFTFYGFRYMKVECVPAASDSGVESRLQNMADHANAIPVRADQFTAWHLRSDFDQIGQIETGNAKVNRLFSNALWGQKDNFLDVPTDCPQRDERLGWTGDAQVFSETACYNMYMPAFYRKYLWDMRAEQSILGGSVPNVVPRLKRGMVAEHGSCPWADAGVIIPWNVYQHYGSKTLLAETYPGMKAWVDCQRKREEAISDPEGDGKERHLVKDGFHFADWLALDNDQPGPFGATDPLYIASAYYYRCADIVAQSAEILGYEEAKEYRELADAIKQAIRKKYFDENGLCICKTQTGSAIAICFGLTETTMPTDVHGCAEEPVPTDGQEGAGEPIPTDAKTCAARMAAEDALTYADEHKAHSFMQQEGDALESRVKANNDHLNTGFVGTTMLCPALTATGHNDTAVTLLLNEDFPSWLYSVNLGATTIWERWDSVAPDGTISAEGMNSLNHYSYGSIEAWMYGYVCGVRPAEPGFRRAVLEPHPDQRLQFANGKLETPMGLYESSWSYDENGNVTYTFTVPFNAEAELQLPDGRTAVLTAGTWEY
ncbi:MAG: glycoside hydrolase family 78 protein [Lachnospiraceae bacterium]|nr:glycoside hydrolase family 78 protein [Lachnospiraceae bacterium]